MKVIFMGTPAFAVPTLEALKKTGHEVVLAVTQPDKPKGRGKSVQFPPVKEKALEYDIPVYQPERIRRPECIEVLKNCQADVIVVVAFGQILPKEILDMPPYGCINVHASLLPKYRGAAPIQWAILNGEKETGVTTMHMDVGLDTGDMILKTTVLIDKKETGGSLHDKLSVSGAKLLVETLKRLEEGTAPRIKQEGETCYAKMLEKALGEIHWEKSGEEIERLVRGLNPWPSAYTSLKGKTLKIWDADWEDGADSGTPGSITEITKDSFTVQTGRGTLKIREVQLEGKKRMTVDAFLRGYELEKGVTLC